MNNILKTSITCLIFFLFQMIALSSYAASPMGYWKTIDDVTGNIKSIVKISESSSHLSGTVVKLFPGVMTICSACNGNLKNKPILGMVVMVGLKQNPKNLSEWTGGTVLDPKTGKIYRCTITVSADGSKLNVRGYVGVSLFGRSQTWIRVPGK
jgi:uncharacterized protein (DUF2147 family)